VQDIIHFKTTRYRKEHLEIKITSSNLYKVSVKTLCPQGIAYLLFLGLS